MASNGVRARLPLVLAVLLGLAAASQAPAQIVHDSGQNVVPVYEGWERNTDGSFTMVFGYFNRNLVQQPIVPVGPDNGFEPGDADRGQPTHFYPRRQQFMFRVQVPRDWGTKELVWTLTVNGRTEKAYGALLPVWELGPQAYEQNRSTTLLRKFDDPVNRPPSVSVQGPPRVAIALADTLTLTVSAKDDGLPTARPPRSSSAAAAARRPSDSPMGQAVVSIDPAWRLGLIWVHHRGPGPVDFAPMRQVVQEHPPADAVTKVRFSQPGTYVLRAYADDGILVGYADVTVDVTASRSQAGR